MKASYSQTDITDMNARYIKDITNMKASYRQTDITDMNARYIKIYY